MRIRTLLALFIPLLIVSSVAAQIPSLLVTPSKATLVPGQIQTFRAVGVDGRLLRGVHWSLSPVYSASIQAGDEVEVSSDKATQFEVVADYEGQRAVASVKVISLHFLPQGTVKWEVTELPGFKTVELIPAVPTPGGPDVFADERSATQRVVRAFTKDGRELWRAGLGGTELISEELIAKQTESISLNKKSVCDSVKLGATKKEIAALQQASDFAPDSPRFQRNQWDIEENGVTCHVYFDTSGSVIKKRRELTNE